MAEDYGLTSLNKILLITSVCDETQVELFHFTEHDLARMRTPRDVIDALHRVAAAVQ
jgi:acyl carrier protein